MRPRHPYVHRESTDSLIYNIYSVRRAKRDMGNLKQGKASNGNLHLHLHMYMYIHVYDCSSDLPRIEHHQL